MAVCTFVLAMVMRVLRIGIRRHRLHLAGVKGKSMLLCHDGSRLAHQRHRAAEVW